MNADLFATSDPHRIPLDGADLTYHPIIDLPIPADELLGCLEKSIDWQRKTITLWGKTYEQPRLIAWHGDAGARYRYSGTSLDPQPWTALLASLRDTVGALAGASFNSVLLNRYRDGRDSMGMHSDDETELGDEPVIASLSLGAVRPLVMRCRRDRSRPRVRLPLASGSLLIMRGATQRNWKHGIAKTRRACGSRINLTFRQLIIDRAKR